MKRLSQRTWLVLILALYLLLAIGYGIRNPLFEAPDEQLHYFTMQTITETGRLPYVADNPDGWMGQEAAQPPLYYVLGALLLSQIDTSQDRNQVWFNPFVRLGDAASPDNINAFVHTPAEAWPWQGYALAAHMLRLLSTLLGLGTLVCIYGSARQARPDQPHLALTAVALVAFLPQFAFLHSAISNDPLVVLMCAAVFWQLLYLWRHPVTTGRLLLLGVSVGLAMLSKTAGLLLLPYAALWLLLLALRQREIERALFLRRVLAYQAALFIPALLLGGWLLVRNWLLYGDPTAANQFVRMAGGDRHYTLLQVLGESGGIWRSFFATFGWMNVAPPAWVYVVWDGIAIVAAAGFILGTGRAILQNPAWRRLPDLPLALLLALWLPLVYAGLVQFLLRTPAAQGRLLFPALVPLAIGAAYGLWQYGRRIVPLAAVLLALLTTLYGLVVVIPRAYAPPPAVTEAEIPATATLLHRDMGLGLELVAAQVETPEIRPADRAELTLYWRAREVPSEAPELVVETFGRESVLTGKLQSYHGRGLYPANLWPAGTLFADHVSVQVVADLAVPVLMPVQVRLVDGAEPVVAGHIKVAPGEWPAVTEPPLAQLGSGPEIEIAAVEVGATEARPGETVPISITWHVLAPTGRALTTYVHLGQPTEEPLAVGDSLPLDGMYPTSWWAAGEVFTDTYHLALPADLPPGRYPLWIGMYDPAGRMPLFVNGERQPTDGYSPGWLTVTE